MPTFNFDSEFVIAGRTDVTLRTTDEALDFVRRIAKQHPDRRWEALRRRLDSVKTQEDANASAGALREMLESQGLLRAEAARS